MKPFKGNNGARPPPASPRTPSRWSSTSVTRPDPLQWRASGCGADQKRTYQGYVDIFAALRAYGRKIDLQFFDATGAPSDEVTARRRQGYRGHAPFAVLNGPTRPRGPTSSCARHHAARQLLARSPKPSPRPMHHIFGTDRCPSRPPNSPQAGDQPAEGGKAKYAGDAQGKDSRRAWRRPLRHDRRPADRLVRPAEEVTD